MGTQVGVVTPYSAQVRLIRTLCARAGLPTSREKGGVEINSVDGYQGREKEAIVISTVRSSSSGGLGFVADWRRANVAFTRARRGLVVIGDASTLGREPSTWAPWLKWVRKTGCYRPSGCLDNLPVPRGEVEAIGLAAPSGKSPEQLLRDSAETWVKGKGDTEFFRKRSRTPSQCGSERSSSTASNAKRRKVEEAQIPQKESKEPKMKK